MKSKGTEARGGRQARSVTAVSRGVLLAAAVLGGALALTGCVVSRTKITKPNVAVPPSWSPSGSGVVTTSSEDLSKWWERFGDNALTGLIEQALKNNTDLRTALSRLREARAQRNLAAANRFPTATVSASNSASKTSGSATTDLLSATFDASWEPDVFGAKGKALEAAMADAKATEADLHKTQVSLAAEVALNYVELRSFQSRVEIARRNTASQAGDWNAVHRTRKVLGERLL
jgi:multidrug efflux system outer membrane protein